MGAASKLARGGSWPLHVTATISRSDHPEDTPNRIEGDGGKNIFGRTPDEIYQLICQRYGPTACVTMDADGVRLRYENGRLVDGTWP
jgi:hypothetical protein